MKNHYWEWPIATYLFLGGLGGGILFLTLILQNALTPGIDVCMVMQFPGLIAILCLALGLFFLVFELGQPDVFYYVFTTKTSIIKWGAVLLSIAVIAAIIWWIPYLPWHWCQFFVPAQGACLLIAGICGLAIMIYTGVFLSSLKSHAFWSTPALPVLFTVSALSTACACIVLSVGKWPETWPFGQTDVLLASLAEAVHEWAHSLDIILIIVEIFVLVGYVLLLLGAGNVTAHGVARRWVCGRTAKLFWIGMVGCGLVIPLILNISGNHLAGIVAAVLALCGGLLLRFLVVYADERKPIPGEERYHTAIKLANKDFVHAWDDVKDLY